MSNLFFYEFPAPYIVDMHNYFSNNLNYKIYYIQNNKSVRGLAFSDQDIEKNLDFAPNYLNNKGKNSIRLFELNRIIKENRPQTIISPEFSFLTIQLLLLRMFYKFKLIVRTDDSISILNGDSYSLKNKISKKILRPHIDNFILCDKQVYDWYITHYNKGLFFPIIRDEEVMRRKLNDAIPLSEELAESHNQLGIRTILYVGRLEPIKNISILISAYKKLRVDVGLVIVGDGSEMDNLKNMASGISNIIFTGRLAGDELLAWYNVADIFVLPSKKEPFGAVVNEALIAGCQSLVSQNAGSIPLINEGVNGYAIDPMDEDDILNKLSILIDNIQPKERIKLKDNLMQESFDAYASNFHLL